MKESSVATAPTSRRKGLGWLWGPAFVAAVAYVDPGNVAANLTSGARYGYKLVWVLVLANTVAVMVQYLSAKTGLVTKRSLPELLGRRLNKRGRIAFLAQAEIIAIATDLAEVVGGAIALQILFGLPLFVGGLITGVVSVGLLGLQSWRGQRTFEHVVMGLLLIISIGFVAGLFVTDVNWGEAAAGVVPRFAGTDSVLLAASMLGATVMPHAIYAHSALVNEHDLTLDSYAPDSPEVRPSPSGAEQASPAATPINEQPINTQAMLRSTRWEVLVSMLVAGTVNIAMLLLAAAALYGVGGTDTIQGAHAAIESTLGPVIGVMFGIGLLASGLASTSVGSYAGIAIMQGLMHRKISVWTMRAITIVPALAVLAIGVDPTWALVISQVILSLGIPFALVPLVSLSSDRELMGGFTNSRLLQIAAWIAVALIIALNLALVYLEITT